MSEKMGSVGLPPPEMPARAAEGARPRRLWDWRSVLTQDERRFIGETDKLKAELAERQPKRAFIVNRAIQRAKYRNLTLTEFESESIRWRGRKLTGEFAHWCDEYDGLPVDETTPEWPCGCYPTARAESPSQPDEAEARTTALQTKERT